MKKLLTLLLASALLASCGCLNEPDVPYSVAHRGCHIDGLVPENSVAGVAMAARFGFRAIECDVRYTADSVMVLMHDRTINRTCRTADTYEEIPEPVKVSDITFEELRTKYVLASADTALRTPVPSLDEELEALKEHGVTPMLHTNHVAAYKRAHEVLGDDFIAFDTNYDALKQARNISSCLILWDPGDTPAEETVEKLNAIGGRCGVSSMKKTLLGADYVKVIRDAGYEVQDSIFPFPYDIEGIAYGCSIVLSDFSLFRYPGSPAGRQMGLSQFLKKDLKPGETIGAQMGKVEFGSTQLFIKFSGEVELSVNGQYIYTLKGEDVCRQGGWRLYDSCPEIKVTALTDTRIERLSAQYYEY